VLAAAVFLAAACLSVRAQEPNLTEEQMKEFLHKGQVVKFKQLSKGVTAIWRLTLSDGTLTHDAAYQSVEIMQPRQQLQTRIEMNFRDSYHFNIAAYELAKLLGLGDMIPVTVERRWRGTSGAVSWWVPAKWDEMDHLKLNLQPPEINAWNKQMCKMWVFTELIYDTDCNQGNILITEDWKLWRIDFTRAFRLSKELQEPRRLTMCDRQLLEKLRQLNEAEVQEKTKPHLRKGEVQSLMVRRDKVVQFFEGRIAEKGESAVLF
jgi:hypothetical protein